MLATWRGFPISTTHALIGAMVGAGGAAVGWGQVHFDLLGRKLLLPLLFSPLAALVLGGSLYILLRTLRLRAGVTKEWCLCVGETERVVAIPQPASVLALERLPAGVSVCVDEAKHCRQRYGGRFLGIGVQPLLEGAHLLSAGAVAFARGLNDTPKIAALLLSLPFLGVGGSMIGTAVAIAAGGLLGARRVAETMSHRITAMNPGQGFAANVSTAFLVIVASRFGLPVSTTHVSVGSLFGIGLLNRQANGHVIRDIVLSWIVTLPCAALFSVILYRISV